MNMFPLHEVLLRTDLEADAPSRRLGVVDGLCTRLDVVGHLVVVAGGKGGEVAETMHGDGVLWGGEAYGTGVSSNGTGRDIVGTFYTNEEAASSDHGVSGEGGALSEQATTSEASARNSETREESGAW